MPNKAIYRYTCTTVVHTSIIIHTYHLSYIHRIELHVPADFKSSNQEMYYIYIYTINDYKYMIAPEMMTPPFVRKPDRLLLAAICRPR